MNLVVAPWDLNVLISQKRKEKKQVTILEKFEDCGEDANEGKRKEGNQG